MSYKPGDTIHIEFATSDSTGAAADADSLPTGTLSQNGADDGSATVTVANIDTGRYKASVEIPSGYAAGDSVNLSIAATVGGVSAKKSWGPWVLDSKRVGDLNDAAALTDYQQRGTAVTLPATVLGSGDHAAIQTDVEGGLTAQGYTTAKAVYLDASILSRLADADYTAPDNAGIEAIKAVTDDLPTYPDNFALLDINGSGQITYSNAAPLTGAETAAAVLGATAGDYNSAGTIGAAINTSGSANDPWSAALPGAYTAGQAGYIVGQNLDAAVSSRSTFAGGAVASVTADVGITQAGADKAWGSNARTLTALGFTLPSVTVGTNNDKTGYSLETAPPTASAIATAAAAAILVNPDHLLATDSSGNVAANNLPVEVLTSAEQGQLTDAVNDLVALLGRTDTAPTTSTIATAVATLLTRLPASITFTDGNVNAIAQAVADKTGYSAEATNLPDDYLSGDEQAALANLDVAVSSRLADDDYTAPDNDDIEAVKTVADKLGALLTEDGTAYTEAALANAPGSTGALTTEQDDELAAIAAALPNAAPGTTNGLALTKSVQFTEGSDDL